jgi:glycosyltransferase involved in cell wall biosynthesis
MTSEGVPWVSSQIGINGQFFVPRLLWSMHRLERMLVPLWYDASSPAYRLLSRVYWNAPNFFHAELARAPIRPFLKEKILSELFLRRVRRGGDPWRLAQAHGERFQAAVLRYLKGRDFRPVRNGPRGVFISWSDISGRLIPFFHEIGWKTVTMQLNCGALEEEIIAAENERYPDLAETRFRAPAGFHDQTASEYAKTDHVISNSLWAIRYLEGLGVARSKTSLLPFAFEGQGRLLAPRTYPRRFSQDRPLRVLHIGQMSLRKGIGRFFEAIEELRDDPVRFTFAGPIAVTLPLRVTRSEKVEILGVVDRARVEELYREADVFLFPTLSDAFGLTQLECMAWRLPLIASPFCGEVVASDVNGIILPAVTSGSIAAAVRRVIADPACLSQFSEHCRIPESCSLPAFGVGLLRIEELLFTGP